MQQPICGDVFLWFFHYCIVAVAPFQGFTLVTFESVNSYLSVNVYSMCLNPLTIPTNSKYVSLRYRDRFLNTFPCGHCAECQKMKSLQMCYRANYEFDALPDDGYVMFDCLSYRNQDLPRLSDCWSMLERKEDFMCFSRLHLRRFLQTLRQRVIRAGYDSSSLRYFYACEYGTKPKRTHRPHIHFLFYVSDARIDPFWLSRQIADVWHYGRTDGLPYKSKNYVKYHNVVRPGNQVSRLRTISYITKYLQKSCLFQKEINKRVRVVMSRLAKFAVPEDPLSWLDSELGRRERLKLLRMVNQFHHTSQHFGECALADMDYNELVKYGGTIMPNSSTLKIIVPLSNYYKRKLFYDLVTVNGSRYWQMNELGRQYQRDRAARVFELQCQRYEAIKCQLNLNFDSVDLSQYVLNDRGYLLSSSPDPSFSVQDRLDDITLFNYSSSSDVLQFGKRGLSPYWLGDAQQGYSSSMLVHCFSVRNFIQNHVYIDSEKEELLRKIDAGLYHLKDGKQSAFELRQKLENLYKMIT